MQNKNVRIVGIDLFCGVGGLTHGLMLGGIEVIIGIDLDDTCKYSFEANNGDAKFLSKDIKDVSGSELLKFYPKKSIKLLAGCAPCQPFSSYSYKNTTEKWRLLKEFGRLIEEIQPDIVTMENVPQLVNFKKAPVFSEFIELLKTNEYNVTYSIVFCPAYGIPQNRKRLVLLASKKGEIKLIPQTHSKENFVTVKDTIGKMEALESGQSSKKDRLHRASKLSSKNLQRIKQSKPGGTWKDWDEELWLDCHKKKSGKSYTSVYGRMKWNEPAPTMTTHCTGIGNGRFGHPEQDRAISLREAALFQTFPKNYKFSPDNKQIKVKQISTHIGNAVPVRLGEVIAKSIQQHIDALK